MNAVSDAISQEDIQKFNSLYAPLEIKHGLAFDFGVNTGMKRNIWGIDESLLRPYVMKINVFHSLCKKGYLSRKIAGTFNFAGPTAFDIP